MAYPYDDEEDPYVMGALDGWLGLPAGNTSAKGAVTPLNLSQQTNGLQDVFQMLGDPNTAAIMAALTGAPTFDYAQEPVDDEPAPIAYTPTLDRLSQSDDEDSQWLAQQVASGIDSVSLAKQIRANAALDDDTKKDYIAIAQTAIKELDDNNKAQQEYASRPVPLSENEKLLRKQGLPMPWEEYTAANVPVADGFDDVGRGNFDAQAMRSARRGLDAQHVLNTTPSRGAPVPYPTQPYRGAPNTGAGAMSGPAIFDRTGGEFGWHPTGPAPSHGGPIAEAIAMVARQAHPDGPGQSLGNDMKYALQRGANPEYRANTKARSKAQATVKREKNTADWIARQKAGTQAAAYAIEAYKQKQAGNTPFRDAVAQRAALLRAAGINV